MTRRRNGNRIVNRYVRAAVLTGVALNPLWLSAQASTQQASSGSDTGSDVLQDIIVSARRKDESIMQVPIAITAISAAALEQQHIESFSDCAQLMPNLSFSYGAAGGGLGISNSRAVAIRGIQGNGTTSFYIDDTSVPE